MRTRAFLALLLLAVSSAAEDLFVPVAVQRSGREGSWWNTEVHVINTTADLAHWAAVFLPAGKNNGELLRLELEPEEALLGHASTVRTDLVPEGSLGALRFVVSPGVAVWARIYNASGKLAASQTLPGMRREQALRRGEVGHLVGLRRNAQFQTNLFLFCPGLEGATVRVRVVGERGERFGDQTYGLAPGGMLVLDDFLLVLGVPRDEVVRAEVVGSAPFFALASVVESRSGVATLHWPLAPAGR